MDHRRLWGRVRSLYDQLEERAPEGFAPVVQVFLAGREEPVEPAFVQTSTDSDVYPWILLQARTAADQVGEQRGPDEYWVHVHENLIARIEIRFVRKGERTIGFAVAETDDGASTTASPRPDRDPRA
jgi:hypothetical protein